MKGFTNLNDYMASLPVERQKRIHTKTKHLGQSVALAELRRSRHLRQTDVATLMGVSQANISKVESGKDIQLSTLYDYVHAIGGEVKIIAQMPTGEVALM